MLVEVILDEGKHPLLLLFHLTYDKQTKGSHNKGMIYSVHHDDGDLDILEDMSSESRGLKAIRSIYSSKLYTVVNLCLMHWLL